MRTGVVGAAAVMAMLLAGCGGDETAAESPASAPSATSEEPLESSSPEPEKSAEPVESAGDACALLDAAFLNDLMDGETTLFGTPYDYREPIPSPSGDQCTFREGSSGLSLQVVLEPVATSETEDHSGRAYNIDVDPVAVPQDGPGTSAVLLTDSAFEGLTEGSFAYGYFFAADDVTVFVKTVGLDVGEDKLRAMADEAADRLAAG